MKVLQIAETRGNDCGIVLFAENLQIELRRIAIDITTSRNLPRDIGADVVLLQYHEELFSDGEVVSLATSCPVPVVIFAHSEITHKFSEPFNGFVGMCPGMIGSTDKPIHVFPHPAWTPERLEDRIALRKEFSLPEDRQIVGTNGFLKFERQFVEIAHALLPEVRRNHWFVELITSPWRLQSPGLISKLEGLRGEYPDHFRFEHTFLDTETLNRRLQACDLLWCWTAAPSSPYASGVIADQYASGTRVIAVDKQQHTHVLKLPNTVPGPDALPPFIECVVEELRSGQRQRHDPSPVSWNNSIRDFGAFLRSVVAAGRSR